MPRTADPTPPPHDLRFAEFFAGIGLVRLGLQRASPAWRCVFANDLDPAKRAIYADHFGHAPSADDVHRLDPAAVPDCDLATASFPCTDLSQAGAQRGIRADESSAFWGFHRVLREMGDRRPRAVLLENVIGMLTSAGGLDFRDAMLAMNQLGYRVDPLFLDARWFVPQSRPRLFIVCTTPGSTPGPHPASGSSPAPTEDIASSQDLRAESRLRPQRLLEAVARFAGEVDFAFRDLPDPPTAPRLTLADVIQDPPDAHADWWSPKRTDYLYHQMFERHQAWVNDHRSGGRFAYATAFRRVRATPQGKRSMAELRTDGIAGCLRTPKGGSARQILVRVGRGRFDVRLLSAVECAALMGAEGYAIDGPLTRALFAFGDAVCVDAVAWLAQHYLIGVATPAIRDAAPAGA
ncbi:MAG: DNA cytosine methyltransferase [Planctomycetota bacterium]